MEKYRRILSNEVFSILLKIFNTVFNIEWFAIAMCDEKQSDRFVLFNTKGFCK